jgi:hypothetical protein
LPTPFVKPSLPFPKELRTPLVLSEYQDLSHAEIGSILIGSILNCSVKAIETRLYRARKQLRISPFLAPSVASNNLEVGGEGRFSTDACGEFLSRKRCRELV